jgi:hypothetical protein
MFASPLFFIFNQRNFMKKILLAACLLMAMQSNFCKMQFAKPDASQEEQHILDFLNEGLNDRAKLFVFTCAYIRFTNPELSETEECKPIKDQSETLLKKHGFLNADGTTNQSVRTTLSNMRVDLVEVPETDNN